MGPIGGPGEGLTPRTDTSGEARFPPAHNLNVICDRGESLGVPPHPTGMENPIMNRFLGGGRAAVGL